MNPQAESEKIEQAGYPTEESATHGEPHEDIFAPGPLNTDQVRQTRFGLLLSVEVMRPGVDTYGDLLNAIAAAWRGHEATPVRPGHEGAIRDERAAPVGLWVISQQ